MRLKSFVVIALCSVFSATAAAERIKEQYPDGKPKLDYNTSSEGKKQGSYREYHPSGKTKILTQYKNDLLHGPYSEWDENGKFVRKCIYREGKLHGTEFLYENGRPASVIQYKDGEQHGNKKIYKDGKLVSAKVMHTGGKVLFDKTPKQIMAQLQKIQNIKIEGPGDENQKSAVRRLMMYRYVCGVPWEEMALDAQMNLEAVKASELCAKLGRLTHKPTKNPGMSKTDYDLGAKGAGRSNLAAGSRTLAKSVDMWMNDSDRSNIDRLGHRRWALNPPLGRVGFGMSGRYSALWCMDKSRKNVPDWDFISFPARGYTPESMFKDSYAWNVSLNLRYYNKPSKSNIKANVWLVPRGNLDVEKLKKQEPLKLNYFNVDTNGFGVPNSIIFRPDGVRTSRGYRYWVQIQGVKPKNGKSDTLEYLVEFM